MADEEKKKPIENLEPKEGNPRPFPTTPRSREGRKVRVFALLVGVNDYQGSVTPLNGCIKDVNAVAGYLRQKFGGTTQQRIEHGQAVNTSETYDHLHLRILTNAEATYENIIQAFEEHLIQGGGTADDSFWFHFSGHGTEQFTAREFAKPTTADGQALPSLEPNGKDQCLVCYNPEGTQERIFLADKELAALIDELNHAVPSKAGAVPHVVVSLDCCHAGSGTRDFKEPAGFKSRHHDFLGEETTRNDGISAHSVRSLDSYYGGYQARLDRGEILHIPKARHVLLAACTNLEQAGDLPAGGVFSSSLVKVLSEAADQVETGTLNYADLFRQTRALARSKRNKQNPQLEPIAGFNPHTAFLEGWALGDAREYEVIPNKGKWFVRCGAIHGLPTKVDLATLPEGAAEEIIVKVYRKAGRELLGHALVKKVGVQEGELALLEDLEGKLEAKAADSSRQEDIAKEPYVAEIFQLPAPPFYVHLEGSEAATDLLRTQWSEVMNDRDADLTHVNILVAQNEAEEQLAEVRVKIDNDGYQIWNIRDDRAWTNSSIAPSEEVPERMIVEQTKTQLRKIARWHRLLQLTNESSRIADRFKVEMYTLDYAQWEAADRFDTWNPAEFFQKAQVHQEDKFVLEVPEAAFITPDKAWDMDREVSGDSVLFGLRLHSLRDKLFYYLYDFKSNAAIDFILDQSLEKKTDEEGIVLVAPINFFLEDNEQHSTIRLKLLVTQTELLDKEILAQSGLDDSRGFGRGRRAPSTDGWQAKTLEVKITRK